MCGIAGFVNKNCNNEAVIQAMNEAMYHRGPDAGGMFVDENTGMTFGHRRLSIVDLTQTGAQPMTSASGRYVICYNGEIYNADSVKKRVKADKPKLSFRGTSDTEILLEAIELYGVNAAIQLCKGMFAVAVYDRDDKLLTLIRDRAGEKPLYYGFVNGHFVFASDLACLQAMPDFHAKIDKKALAGYMRYGFIPNPQSIYEGIYQLPPGSSLILRPPYDSPVINAYWSMKQAVYDGEENPFTGTQQEAADELERLLTDAVTGQMMADVPLGAFLSGGIDSPLIVSLMQNISTGSVKTFTIGFEDKKYNEAEYAKDIANHLGTEHTELYVTEKELKEVIPKLGTMYSEPFADSSQIPTYLVSKLARSKVTVSLSGDAGDELFCGYNTYYKINDLFWKINNISESLKKSAGAVLLRTPFSRNNTFYRSGNVLLSNNIMELHEAVCYRMARQTDKIVTDTALSGDVMRALFKEPITNMMYKDMLTYHPDDILVKVDRAGMAVSLENRIPMLDKDVMEFAWRLPVSYKYDNGVTKKILKDILYKYVPKDMLDRPKKGFSVPLTKWLSEGDTREWARTLIFDSTLAKDGYFDYNVIVSLWKQFENKKINDRLLWKILMAEQWYQAH